MQEDLEALKWYSISAGLPQAGTKECLCSSCRKPIIQFRGGKRTLDQPRLEILNDIKDRALLLHVPCVRAELFKKQVEKESDPELLETIASLTRKKHS